MSNELNPEDAELSLELRDFVGSRLADVLKDCGPNTLARNRPEDWCAIAGHLCQGKSKTSLRKDKGGSYDYGTIETVLAQLEDAEGLDSMKQRFAIRAAKNLNVLDDLKIEVSMRLLDQIRSGEYVPEAKDLQHLAVAAKFEGDVYMRAKDEASVITEERKTVTVQDVQAYAERLKAMKRAEVIELED